MLVVQCEHRAGAGQPGLDLVGDQQRTRLVAEPAGLGEVAVRRHHDPGLALDRLHQDGGGALGDRPRQGLGVAVRHGDEAGRVGAVVRAGRVVGGERHQRGGAAVEVVRGHHDLRPVRGHALHPVGPLACHLQCGLHRLGAGVHRQHHLGTGELGQLAAEQPQLVVVERPGRQCHPAELFGRGADQLGMPVAEVQRRIPGQQVQMVPSLHIGHPRTLRLGDHHRQRVVVVRAEALVEVDEVGGAAVEVGQRRHAFSLEPRARRFHPSTVADTVRSLRLRRKLRRVRCASIRRVREDEPDDGTRKPDRVA